MTLMLSPASLASAAGPCRGHARLPCHESVSCAAWGGEWLDVSQPAEFCSHPHKTHTHTRTHAWTTRAPVAGSGRSRSRQHSRRLPLAPAGGDRRSPVVVLVAVLLLLPQVLELLRPRRLLQRWMVLLALALELPPLLPLPPPLPAGRPLQPPTHQPLEGGLHHHTQPGPPWPPPAPRAPRSAAPAGRVGCKGRDRGYWLESIDGIVAMIDRPQTR